MARSRLVPACVSASLAAVLLLSATVPLVAASPAGLSPSPQDGASPIHRVVAWVGIPADAPTRLRVNSVSVGSPSADEFQITYANGSFTLEYERVAGGPVTSRYTVTVAGLVEWLPSGDGLFVDGSVIAYTAMGSSAFGAVSIEHIQTTTSSGIEIHSFLIQSNNHEVTLNLTISQGFVAQDAGSTLTPMEAELTMLVNHVMSLVDTRLAVHLSLSTDQRVNLENESWNELHQFNPGEHAVNVTNGTGEATSSVFFAWSNQASVNGQASAVGVSGPELNESSRAYDLYLSYPRITTSTNPNEVDVEHDPSLGVVSVAYASLPVSLPGGIQADVTLYVVSVAAVTALVAGTAILANRRRREGR